MTATILWKSWCAHHTHFGGILLSDEKILQDLTIVFLLDGNFNLFEPLFIFVELLTNQGYDATFVTITGQFFYTSNG